MKRVDPREIFSNLPALRTERLQLRKLALSDAQDMFEYASDPEVTKYVGWQAHRSVKETRGFIKSVLELYEDGEVGSWGLVLKENNKLIGTCGYIWWSVEHSLAEIGYAMGRKYWNLGLMTEAVREILGFGFNKMKLNRVEAQCMVRNKASGRVLEKVGMGYEATLRKRMYTKGEYQDVRLYALLKSEFDSQKML